jgi:hypothetical protein
MAVANAPFGTATVNDVVVPAEGVTAVAPKYTKLLLATVSKFEPVIVTEVPGVATLGETLVISGFACVTETIFVAIPLRLLAGHDTMYLKKVVAKRVSVVYDVAVAPEIGV